MHYRFYRIGGLSGSDYKRLRTGSWEKGGHMASPTGTVKAKYETSPAATESRQVRWREQWNEEIARRAYELYEESGKRDGEALSHWLQAEAEISAKKETARNPLLDAAVEAASR